MKTFIRLPLTLVTILCLLPAVIAFAGQTINCSDNNRDFTNGTMQDARCHETWSNGLSAIWVEADGIRVVASTSTGMDGKIYYREIAVKNISHVGDVDVDPLTFSAEMNDGAIIQASNPDVMIDKAERHQQRLNFLATVLDSAAYGNQSVIVAQPLSDGRTVAYNESAADVRGDERSEQITSSANVSRSSALRRNTVEQGKYVRGYVYFEHPKGKQEKKAYLSSVHVVIDGNTFIF